MVGCLIVKDDKIIGEGYTDPYGGSHAEVNAIKSVKNRELLKSATLYVTLEPCSHHGKTPPCCDLIISFKKRPYIILKWAQTKNGFVAPKNKNSNRPFWISGKLSRQLVHQWRAEEQAILVGANTVIKDNPSLTTRHIVGKNPIRIVVSNNEKLSRQLNIFNGDAQTILLNIDEFNKGEPIGTQICDKLFSQKITSLIVEGGPKTLDYFLSENLWDEARIFEGNTDIKQGIKAPKILSDSREVLSVGQDNLWYITNKEA